MRQRNIRRRGAFTLIEVLLVAGILALLAALAIPKLYQQAEQARIDLAKVNIGRNGNVSKALEQYRYDMGKYPETDEGLAPLYATKATRKEDRYKGPYLPGVLEELKDPWGNPFEYKCPGQFNEDGFDIWSRGPDGIDDNGRSGSDDIKNWIDR